MSNNDIKPAITFKKVTDEGGDVSYDVFVDGDNIGGVYRDENVTAGYYGAWRGSFGSDGDSRAGCARDLIGAKARSEAKRTRLKAEADARIAAASKADDVIEALRDRGVEATCGCDGKIEISAADLAALLNL
jgi:hypothetical protein